jgi:heptosyltransferase-2
MTPDQAEQQRILICGTNWIGDSIMMMPAIQAFHAAHPSAHITMLVKPSLVALWTLHADVDQVLSYRPDSGGTFAVAGPLRDAGIQTAYVFPNSFRSALIPYLAKIPIRRGFRGKWRHRMLTDVIHRPLSQERHQALEYFDILQIPTGTAPLQASLQLGDHMQPEAWDRFGLHHGEAYVALIPGAARGASKCWPQGHFEEIGRQVAARGLHPLVLGGPGEEGLCSRVARACGAGVLSLAGSTSLVEFAAVLSGCRAVVCNDSGGMHVAAAVGCPLVAVFGLTDPATTGPLGSLHEIVTQTDTAQSRDIPRTSASAAAALRSITPDRVLQALERLLEHADGPA